MTEHEIIESSNALLASIDSLQQKGVNDAEPEKRLLTAVDLVDQLSCA